MFDGLTDCLPAPVQSSIPQSPVHWVTIRSVITLITTTPGREAGKSGFGWRLGAAFEGKAVSPATVKVTSSKRRIAPSRATLLSCVSRSSSSTTTTTAKNAVDDTRLLPSQLHLGQHRVRRRWPVSGPGKRRKNNDVKKLGESDEIFYFLLSSGFQGFSSFRYFVVSRTADVLRCVTSAGGGDDASHV